MKIMYLCITNSYNGKKGFDRKNVYDCTRKYWDIKDLPKAEEAEYIVGVANKKIEGIYKNISGWKLVKDMPELINDNEVKNYPKHLSNYAFSGEEETSENVKIEIEKDYIEHPFQFNQAHRIHYNF